ncbi:YgfY [Hyphomicrobium sulfonivorans]|uniref:FAD assembly factor SdhE n=1 Tax=Hyphomicrobium sulfonivorans TaxID=121290 RepID=A0A109BDN6_HYPSL|nr:succinate dehydrogenase assembly factor 2 [Hyphomicrobium sulfonivorans]KWT66873.1 YgfY [Hyphomicrobium sulfonivorans]
MHDDLQIRRRRAAYRAAHRGTKEMDIVLGRYADAHLESMTAEALTLFEELLAEADPVITRWFTAGTDGEEAGQLTGLVADLRAFHGLEHGVSGVFLETR